MYSFDVKTISRQTAPMKIQSKNKLQLFSYQLILGNWHLALDHCNALELLDVAKEFCKISILQVSFSMQTNQLHHKEKGGILEQYSGYRCTLINSNVTQVIYKFICHTVYTLTTCSRLNTGMQNRDAKMTATGLNIYVRMNAVPKVYISPGIPNRVSEDTKL